jgi:hypothetical protein
MGANGRACLSHQTTGRDWIEGERLN